jgi:hypothetical protein
MRSSPIILILVVILVSCQSNRDKKLYEKKLQAFEAFADSLKSIQVSSFSQEKIDQAFERSYLFRKPIEELGDPNSKNYVAPTTDQLIRYRQTLMDLRQVLVNWKESKDQ